MDKRSSQAFSAWRLPATAGILPANRSQAGGVGGATGADNDGKERTLKERVLERRKRNIMIDEMSMHDSEKRISLYE